MSRIIIHKRISGKYDYTITGDDVNESILVATVQGFEHKADVISNLKALRYILTSGDCDSGMPLFEENMTYNEYYAWKRKHDNQLRRNSRARGRK